jgi:D-methionine transport system ATP-binding protein
MIELRGVSKRFDAGDREVQAVAPTDLTVDRGRIVGIVGFSGAGKSTLLRLVNLLERPTSGTVHVDGKDLTSLGPRDLRRARRDIGIIFQGFNLMARRTAVENVAFPLEVAGVGRDERMARARESLARVDLLDCADSFPAQLSGGQKQRVGIARALVTRPKVLLSDEATSALDPHTTLTILRSLKELNEDLGLTIIVVTHEINVVSYLCDEAAVMERGHIVERLQVKGTAPQPSTPLGRFLFASATGWDEETVRLAAHVAEATA